MGVCRSVEYIDDIELDDFKPLLLIKPFKYKKFKTTNKCKNHIYWLYCDEYHCKNNI